MAIRRKTKVPEPETDDVASRRRRDLLDAACSLIAKGGLEGLRTRDVAARAGVNISTLHYYFGTKEELLMALVEHANEKFLQGSPPGRARVRKGDAARPLRAHMEDAWHTFEAEPELSAVLQELVLRGQRDPAARKAFRAMHDGWNRRLEQLIRQEMEQGALRADLDPPVAARVVTSFIIGAMVQLGVHPKAFDFQDAADKLDQWLAASD